MAKWNYNAMMAKAKELDTEASTLDPNAGFMANIGAYEQRARELDSGVDRNSLAPLSNAPVVQDNPTPFPKDRIGPSPNPLIQTGAGIADHIERVTTPKTEAPTPIDTYKLSRDGFAMDEDLSAKYGSYENYLTDIVTDEYKAANPGIQNQSLSEAMEKWNPGSSTRVKPTIQTGTLDYTSGMIGGPVTAADRVLLQNEQDIYAGAQKRQNDAAAAAAKLGFNTLAAFREYQLAQYNDAEQKRRDDAGFKPIETAVDHVNDIQAKIDALTKPNYGAGNINLSATPHFDNGDGTYSSVDSISFHDDNTGLEILIPTVVQINGQWFHVDEDQAIEQYRKTGKYLGAFRTPEDADAYAIELHKQQEQLFSELSKYDAQYQAAVELTRGLVDEYNNGIHKDYIASHNAYLREYDPVSYYYSQDQNYADIQNVLTGLSAQLATEPAGTAHWNTLKRQYDQLYANRMIFTDDDELDALYKGGALDEETRRKIDERMQYILDNNLYADPLQDPELQALMGESDHERNWLAAGQEIKRRDFAKAIQEADSTTAAYLGALTLYASTGGIPAEVVESLGVKHDRANSDRDVRKIRNLAKAVMEKQGFSEREIANVMDTIQRSANKVNTEYMANMLKDYATAGVGQGINAYLASFVTSAASLMSIAEPFRAEFSKSTDRTLDPNSPLFTMSNATNAIRGGITDKVNWNYQGVDMFDEAFGIVTSGIESLLASRVPGGIGKTAAGETAVHFGALLLSGGAAAQSLLESAQKGAPIGEAVLSAGIAGTFEALFENISIGNLKALADSNVITFGDIIDNLLKAFTVNFEEEGATTLANDIFDWLKHSPTSNFNTSIGELMTQINPVTGKVYTEKEAKAKTWANVANEVLHDAFTGGIQGALMGTVSQISAIKAVRQYEKLIGKDLNARGYIGTSTLAAMYTGGESRRIGREFNERLDAIINGSESDSVKREQFKELVTEMRSDLDRLPSLLVTEAKQYGAENMTEARLEKYIEAVQNLDARPLHVESELETKARNALGMLAAENVSQEQTDEAVQLLLRVASGAENINANKVSARILQGNAFRNAVTSVTGYSLTGDSPAAIKRSLEAIAKTIRNQTVVVNQTSTAVSEVNRGAEKPSLIITGGDDKAVTIEEAAPGAPTAAPSGGNFTRDFVRSRISGYGADQSVQSTATPSEISYETSQTENTNLADAGYTETVEQPVTQANETHPTVQVGDENLTEDQFVKLAVDSGQVTADEAREVFRRALAGDRSNADADDAVRFAVAEAQKTQSGADKPTAQGRLHEPELDDTRRRMQAVANFFLSGAGIQIKYTDDPRLAGENGFIDLKTGTIYVNINAPEAQTDTQAGLAWVLGHELFHGAKKGQDNSRLVNQILGTYDADGNLIEDGLIQKLANAGVINGYYADLARDPSLMQKAIKNKQELYIDFYKGRKYKPEDYAKFVTDEAIREEIAGDVLGSILGVQSYSVPDEGNGVEYLGRKDKLGITMPRADFFDRIAGIDARPLYDLEMSLKDKLALERESGMRFRDIPGAFDAAQQQIKSLLYDISSALEDYRDQLADMRPASEYQTNGNEPAPEDIAPDFAEAKLSVASPYKMGSAAEREFVDALSPEAHATYDVFDTIYKVGNRNRVGIYVGQGEKQHIAKRNITTVTMTTDVWNEYVRSDPAFAETARKLAEALPNEIRLNANINEDGTIVELPREKELKLVRSFSQRIVDALPTQVDSSTYETGGRVVRVSNKDSIDSVGGEAYRRALVAERRKMYAEGRLPTKRVSGLSKDKLGTMGFLAPNNKTIASGDFTTICPQIYFNKGCFYCYRRAALRTGVNNKLTGEAVWYTGEILQMRQEDIDELKKTGGLRIQSFGDWMEQFSGQLADMLIDADTVGLPVKIITKEPSMIETVALLNEQGVGKSVYFNLSADYVIETQGTINNQGGNWTEPRNPDRPYMRDENGTVRWKRALTVEEAYEYRKKFPFVNVRIVANRVEEFIRGLKDPRVQVVTGFHGKKDSTINNLIDRGYVDSTTGETVVELEPIGDAGMPKFAFDFNTGTWSMTYAGKESAHKKLAQAIQDNNLESLYYLKSCCITGRCATCLGKCGKAANNYFIKNATNADTVDNAYWQTHMQSSVDNDLLIDEAEEANAMLSGTADAQLDQEENLRLPSTGRHSIADMDIAAQEYLRRVESGTFFSGGGLVDYALRGLTSSSMAVELDKKAAAIFATNVGKVHIGDVVDYVKGDEIQKLKGKLEYFHASPVCKNYSRMNRKRGQKADGDVDLKTAQATADAIGILTPKVFTLEQVPEYLGSNALKIITDQLDALGYKWDTTVASAFDYGGATSRSRLMLRAVRDEDLPPLPKKHSGYSWYEATSNLLNQLPEKDIPDYLQERINNTPDLVEAIKTAETPILVLYGTSGRQAAWASADKPCPSITTKMDGARIIFPDGTVRQATARFFAQVMGLDENYQFTQWRGQDNQSQGYKVVGNGVPVQLTQAFFGELLRDTLGAGQAYNGTEYSGSTVRQSSEIDEERETADLVNDAIRMSIAEPEGLSDFQRRNIEFNLNETNVGDPLKTVAGFTLARYGWTKKNPDGVGKKLSYSDKRNNESGSQIYAHKLYAKDVIREVGAVDPKLYDDAVALLREKYPDFQWNTIMYRHTNKRDEIRFDEAPNFDTAREPYPGDMVTVNVADGTVKLSTGKTENKQIWHHKWMWVKNNYQELNPNGFDVADAWNWSKLWLSVIRDTKNKTEMVSGSDKLRLDNRGIANGMGEDGRWWNEQLRYFGLPLEGEEADYNSRTRADAFVSHLKATQQERANAPQTDTSEGTSLNQVPASMTNFKFKPTDRVLDWGGGRYDAARKFMQASYPGLEMFVYDPFNRTQAYNDEVLRRFENDPATVVTINNVLNVINSELSQREVVSESKKYLAPDGVAIFTIYEGDRSGIGEVTKAVEDSDDGTEISTSSWQNNLEAAEYVPMIGDYYKYVDRVGNFILASDDENALKEVKKNRAKTEEKKALSAAAKPFIAEQYDMKTAIGIDSAGEERRSVSENSPMTAEERRDALTDDVVNRMLRRDETNERHSVAGEHALTANLKALAKAMEREAKGQSAREIFDATHWWKDPADGKWRFEINDDQAAFRPSADTNLIRNPVWRALRKEYHDLNRRNKAGQLTPEEKKRYNEVKKQYLGTKNATYNMFWKTDGGKIGDVVDHKALFAAYPDLRNVPFKFGPLDGNTFGEYSSSTNSITLNQKILGDTASAKAFRQLYKNELPAGVAPTEDNIILSVLLHEMQHQIQHTEDFAAGGNDKWISKLRTKTENARAKYETSARSKGGDAAMRAYERFRLGRSVEIIDDASGDVLETITPASTSLADRIDAMKRWIDQTKAAGNAYYGKRTDPIKTAFELYAQADDDYRELHYLDGAPANAFQLYWALRGEQEARNTQARQKMTAKTRYGDRPILPSVYKTMERFKEIDDRYLRDGTVYRNPNPIPDKRMSIADEQNPDLRYSVPENAATPDQAARDAQIMDIVQRMQAQQRDRDFGVGTPNFGFTQRAARDYEDWRQSARTMNPISDEQLNNTQDYRANRDAVQYPRTVDKSGKITSRAAQTIRNAGITSDSMAATLDQAAANGAFDFQKRTDNTAMKKAKAAIERNGWDEEYAKYKDAVDKGMASKDITAMGMALYQAAATAGDNYAALDLAVLMARDGNNVGAALQARRIMNRLGPDGQLYMAVRGIENIADHIRQLYPDKQISVDRALLDAYRNALISGDQDAIDAARADINQAIADQLPADWKEKLNNWRYMSMLTNPATHVRNLAGNAGFIGPRMMKQAIKAGLERVSMGKAGEGSNRTTTFLNPFSADDRARFKAGWDDYVNVMDLIQNGGKQTGPRDEIEKLRTIYKNKVLEGVRSFNTDLLDREDTWFSRPAYSEALASFLKARGIDGEDYANGNISDAVKAAAQDHAIREAQKATYRDHNQFSDLVADLGKKGKLPTATKAQKLASAAIEAVLPFKRTPANILARAIEYSPAELVQIVFSDIGKVHKAQAVTRAAEAQNNGSEATIRAVNDARAEEANALSTMLDHIASSATGTGLLLIGALLRHMGILHGGADDDDDQAQFDKTRGIQEYSIDIGGKNYTLDWLAPEILPVFTGVALYDKLIDRDERSENGIIGDLGDILIGMTEPMLNMSMLKSVNDLISTVKYLDEGAQLAGIAKNVGLNYLSQYVPTLAGKIESVVEPTRNTTFIDRNSPLGKDEQYFIAKLANKSLGIPGVEYNQVKYYDAWGREQDNGNLLRRVVTNMLSPGYLLDDRSTPYDEELMRLQNAGVDKRVLPQRASQSTRVDDQYLTAEEYELFTKTQGEANFQIIGDLLDSKAYADMDDEEKASAVSAALSDAKKQAENAVRALRGEDVKATNADESGLDAGTYILANEVYNNAVAPTGYKTTSSGNAPTWAKMLEVLNDGNFSQADRLKFVNAKSGRNEDFKTWKEAVDYYNGQKQKAKK